MNNNEAEEPKKDALRTEKLLLPGWDPTDPVPAIAYHPEAQIEPLPCVFLFHGIHGRKEVLDPWARDLAGLGFFVLAVDQHFHGERAVAGVMDRENIPALGEEYSVFVHQSAIAHTARDFPIMVEYLEKRREIDLQRIGVAGISMGGSLALVLAWQQERISSVVSLIGACNFWWDVTKLSPGKEQEKKKEGYGLRVKRLVDSIDPWTRLSLIPPKAVAVINGRDDRSIDIASIRQMSKEMKKHYADHPDRFLCVEEPVGHHATDSMKNRANGWFVRTLGSGINRSD